MRHFAIAAALLAATAWLGVAARGDERGALQTPMPVKRILEVRRFTLATSFPYSWSREKLDVSSGALVVLEVDPKYVMPTTAFRPVLYAGNLPVQRLNQGDKSGRVIGLIPGNVDLATTPIWFGAPELPDRVTADMARTELGRAEKAGIRATPRTKSALAERPVAVAPDLAALLRTVGADLVLVHSPQEKELARIWRLPVARAPPAKPD